MISQKLVINKYAESPAALTAIYITAEYMHYPTLRVMKRLVMIIFKCQSNVTRECKKKERKRKEM